MSATEMLAKGDASDQPQTARLVLKFWDNPKRELYHAEFYPPVRFRNSAYIKQRDNKGFSFTWSKGAQALSVLFLEYACAGMENRTADFSFPGERRGSLAATIADAMAKNTGYLIELFKVYPPEGGPEVIVNRVLDGHNLDGKEDNERRLLIHSDYLPPACVEIYLEGRLLTKPEELRELNAQLRQANKLEQSRQPPPSQPARDEQQPEKSAEQKQQAEGAPKKEEPETKNENAGLKQPDLLSTETGAAAGQQGASSGMVDLNYGGFKFEFKPPAQPLPDPNFETETPPLKIDPTLYEIQKTQERQWLDSKRLINFGRYDSTADIWTIRDASEGVLIFGAVGSGKTSGSGSAIATALLSNGYGGLVLTAKTDEARRWLRLCERTNRSADCIHVQPGSGHKLNILQYEGQRPGERFAITEGLIDLFRTIVAVMASSQSDENKNDFWTHSTDEMMRGLLEFFQMAGEPITIRSIVRFIRQAPLQPDPFWRKIEYFGDVIARAEAFAKDGTSKDRDVFMDSFEYWRTEFPKMPDVTRGGIITGFTAMAGVLKGRDIYDCIGTDTNLTPEMILSGKIVILDFPTKGDVKGGLMVQAAWKLLFQQAIERRADKGQPTARPVFLWEDEGHTFFSKHDPDFQPTARDCRACHVVMSQNLPNFYRLGHNKDSVHAVFSAMNTHIFHTNGDETTNRWASESIGMINRRSLQASGGMVGAFPGKGFSLFPKNAEEVKSVGGKFSIEDKLELAVRPEQFGDLKKGGPPDGKCEAVIHWLSHQFECNKNQRYCVRTFEQEQRPPQPGDQNQ
jgi:hypothetical protein